MLHDIDLIKEGQKDKLIVHGMAYAAERVGKRFDY